MNTNLTKEVEAIGSMSFEGNITPMEWFSHILCDSGKPDAISIMLLSDIVYWYRPTIIRNESTGKIIGYRKKFKADLLQRSYTDLESQFGFSRSQIKDALRRLEKNGLILRVFRNISNHGSTIANVMFLKPFPEKIKQITKSEELGIENFPHTSGEISPDVCGTLSPHLDKFPHTYTETTTKISTNNSLSCASTLKVKKTPTKPISSVEPKNDEREIEMLKIWNEVVEESNSTTIQLTPKRAKLLTQRLKETFNNDISLWKDFCLKITSSKFLMGEVTKFKAQLDWTLREENMLKVMENSYGVGDRSAKTSSSSQIEASEEIINDPIWKQTREELRKRLGEGTFKSWISKLSFNIISGNIAHFIAPTKFIKEWIESNYNEDIKRTFNANGVNIQEISIQTG